MGDVTKIMPKKSSEEIQSEERMLKVGALAFVAFFGVSFIFSIVMSGFFSPEVCSYEFSGATELSNLHPPADLNMSGTMGQTNFTLKGQFFCRDTEGLLRSMSR